MMLLVRLACGVALVCVSLTGVAHANCASTVSQLMSKDTEKLVTRYQRVLKRSSKLSPEGCRIARALEPKLADQIAALKESGCTKDPNTGPMVTDIVRGHEDDLAGLRKAARSDCR